MDDLEERFLLRDEDAYLEESLAREEEPMPRATQAFEERVLSHFRTAPLGEAKLLHRLVTSAIRERAKGGQSSPTQPRKRKPAAGSGSGGKKKATRRRGAQTPPADDDIPPS